MSFLTPLYLAGALLVALPIALHLLRRDVAPPVPFTAVSLLRKTSVERSRRHRLRDLLLLAARVCALLLLAASFARPYLAGAKSITSTTVIAVDRSFSMAAPGRAERARALAREAVDAAAGGEQIAVVAFDERADVVARPGTAADARAAIAGIQPGYGATRYASALDKASEILADADRGRLVVISDLQRTGFDTATAVLPEGVALTVRDAGAPASNLSVTALAVDLARRSASATIRNDGAEARSTDVRAKAGETTLPAKRVSIGPGDAADVVFETPAGAGQVEVAVEDTQGYAADNRRFAVAERRGLPRVLVVTGGPASTAGFYLSHALQADSGEGADFEIHSIGGSAFAAMAAAQVREQSTIVLLSTHGLDRRVGETLRAFLSGGGGLFVAAAPEVDASVLSTLLQWDPPLVPKDSRRPRVLAATDLRHPIFRPFDAVAANFGQMSFERAWQIDAASSAWRVIARFTDGLPALIERQAGREGEGGGRVLLFASDIDRRWNDFPLHPTFVPFVQEVVRYLGARPLSTLSYVVADVPAGMPPTPGFARAGDRTVAVNVDPRESRVDRVTPAEFAKLVTRTSRGSQPRAQRLARETESHQNYWRYGLMLLLATLVAEAFVGSR